MVFGCGSAVLMDAEIGRHGLAMAVGLCIVAAVYGLGAISGAHLDPAVSLGQATAGRMSVGDAVAYAAPQSGGAIVGALCVWAIASSKADDAVAVNGLGRNGYGPGFLGEYGVMVALLFEVVAPVLFVTVNLSAAAPGAPAAFAGLATGLTLAAIHLVGVVVTGVSAHPARSIGPALFAGGGPLADLWVFIVAPLAGGAAAGGAYAAGLSRAHRSSSRASPQA